MIPPDPRANFDGTPRGYWRRMSVFWPAKMAGIIGGMIAFFAVYFWILRNLTSPAVEMPLTVVDRWIAFVPVSLTFYLSLWAYVSLVPALLCDRASLRRHAAGAIFMAALGLGIFFVWPTCTPSFPVDWSRYPAFAFMQGVDAPGNACPSLHAAFAVYSALWLSRIFRDLGAGFGIRGGNWIWCIGILYSTLATRQHVFIDLLAGGLLGMLAGWVSVFRLGRISQSTAPRRQVNAVS